MKDAKFKILLVEDDAMSRRLATIILRQLGCEVTEALTGEQALKLNQELSFDAIFMDLGLPDMNGISVAVAMRENSSKNYTTPIIALTANDNQASREECHEAGMNDFLAKPITEVSAAEVLSKLDSDINKIKI